jgi:uncharacterized coiled-coil DUF342 family protein
MDTLIKLSVLTTLIYGFYRFNCEDNFELLQNHIIRELNEIKIDIEKYNKNLDNVINVVNEINCNVENVIEQINKSQYDLEKITQEIDFVKRELSGYKENFTNLSEKIDVLQNKKFKLFK